MLKPPHPVARAAYALAMAINPNNHARDGGRASSAMEIEAVAGHRRDVRLDRAQLPRAPDLQRHHRQSRSSLDCRPDCRQASAFWARSRPTTPTSASPRCSSCPIRAWKATTAGRICLDALEPELRTGRCRDRGGDPGHHGDRGGRSAGRDSRPSRKVRFSHPRRCRVRRLFQADSGGPGRAGAAGLLR